MDSSEARSEPNADAGRLGVTVRVLGSIAIARDGVPLELTPKQVDVVCALVAAGPDGLSSSQLVAELWPDGAPSTASSSCRNLAAGIRKKLPVGVLPTRVPYRFNLGAEAVDLWHLRDVVRRAVVDWSDPGLTAALSTGEPFRRDRTGPFGPVLEAVASEVSSLRRRLARRLVAEAVGPIFDAHLDFLGSVVAADRSSPNASALVVGAISAGGEDFVDEYVARHAAPGCDLDSLRSVAAEVTGRREPAAERSSRPLPASLADRRTDPIAASRVEFANDFASALDHALSGRDARSLVGVVTGPSAIGKTRFVAEVASLLADRGTRIVHVAAKGGAGPPLEAIADAIHGWSGPAEELDGTHGSDARLELWARIVEPLVAMCQQGPVAVVVDRAHDIAPEVAELLTALLGRSMVNPLAVLVAVDGVEALPASVANAVEVLLQQVPQLELDEALELMDDRWPDIVGTQRRILVQELLIRSGGSPVVLSILANTVDDETGAIGPAGGEGLGALLEAVRRLDTGQRLAGIGAAVIGRPFTAKEVARIEDRGVDEITDDLRSLQRLGYLDLDEGEDLWRFSNEMIPRQFLRSTNAERIAARHLGARRGAADIHDFARHSSAASSKLVTTEVAEALLASANAHVESGDFRAALDRFHEVEVLGWGFFDTVSLASYASVLHRVGTRARAQEVRSAAFRAALDDDDHAVALSAALAGLPEAEDTAGDSVRVAQLRQVDHQALSEADRTLLFTNLARQTALLGHPVEAVEAARSALEAATSDGERSAAATALWLSAGPLVHPRERLQRFLDALGDQRAPQAWTPRLHQLEALSNFELGRLREAARSNELSATAAARQLDVLRHWHSELLRSSMFHARGLREAASVSAQAANALATDWAIAEGVAALGVHLFVDAWVRGDLATMELVIDSAGEGMGHSLLVRSGGVVAAARRGQDVSQRAVEMVEDQLAAPGTHMLAVLALMCDAASGSLPRDLASDILDTFDRHRQTLIVIGAGAACLGPVEWYRHKLTGDMADLEEALVCCDRAGALLWSALVLRELVDQHGRDDLAERCHSLGVLTGLEPED